MTFKCQLSELVWSHDNALILLDGKTVHRMATWRPRGHKLGQPVGVRIDNLRFHPQEVYVRRSCASHVICTTDGFETSHTVTVLIPDSNRFRAIKKGDL